MVDVDIDVRGAEEGFEGEGLPGDGGGEPVHLLVAVPHPAPAPGGWGERRGGVSGGVGEEVG